MLRLAALVAAVSLLGTTAAHSVIACNQDDIQESPIGGGIMSVDVMRASGADPYMKAAYDRGQGWLDDALDFRQLPWDYRGPFPLQDMTKFVGSPGRTFLVRFYGFYRDFGERRPFRIRKDCTATQTRISYYNAFDDYPNVVVVISWDREYREPPLRAAPPKKRMPPKKRRLPAKKTR
jgi:hypothetical protein